MILTVTLNPAVDKRYVVESLRTGGVVRVKECSQTAGGKGLNAARAAQRLGEAVATAGIAGGLVGEYILRELERDGLRPVFVRAEGESRTCIDVFDEGAGAATRLLEPGFALSGETLEAFCSLYQTLLRPGMAVCLCGSLPPGAPGDLYVRLTEAAREAGCRVLLDGSGEGLRRGVEAGPDLIKPNLNELRELTGEELAGEEAAVRAARMLRRDRGIGTVVVSLGGGGALVVCAQGVLRGIAPPVSIVNTVGCGDAMVGAFACGMVRGMPVEQALRLAVAVSAAAALHTAPGCFRREDLDRLLREVEVVRLEP